MLQGGISTNQTGLTIGSTYYVQPDGTLATSAGTPSVEAGKALSATSLFLSDTPVTPVAAGTEPVASGTLPNGKPVVLKADGTVEVVAQTTTTFTQSIPAGSPGTTSDLSVACDPNTANKFVVVYKDGGNSNYGTAKVGTLSGTSISYGSAVVFNALALEDNVSSNITWNFIVYGDNDADGVSDAIDNCPNGTSNWTSTTVTDYDSDGCQDQIQLLVRLTLKVGWLLVWLI